MVLAMYDLETLCCGADEQQATQSSWLLTHSLVQVLLCPREGGRSFLCAYPACGLTRPDKMRKLLQGHHCLLQLRAVLRLCPSAAMEDRPAAHHEMVLRWDLLLWVQMVTRRPEKV